MSAFLLDVNVLIALMWPAHDSHNKVLDWFGRHERAGWATCPVTQAGFVRIVTNIAFSADAVTPQEAIKILQANCGHSSHHFWSDEISIFDAVQSFRQRLTGHRQITDAYLLGLVLHKKGRLATLDRSILSLVPESSGDRESIVVI